MGAQIGPRDVHFGVARPDLLRQVTGISPDAVGKHAFLKDAGYKSVQRLVLEEVNGGILAGLWLGELKSHAKYLYSNHRAEEFVSAASEGGWSVHPNAHIGVQNWERAGLTVLALHTTVILSDEQFDSFVVSSFRAGEGVVVDPVLTPSGQLLAGFVAADLEAMVQEASGPIAEA